MHPATIGRMGSAGAAGGCSLGARSRRFAGWLNMFSWIRLPAGEERSYLGLEVVYRELPSVYSLGRREDVPDAVALSEGNRAS